MTAAVLITAAVFLLQKKREPHKSEAPAAF